jgi:hypothetical protein
MVHYEANVVPIHSNKWFILIVLGVCQPLVYAQNYLLLYVLESFEKLSAEKFEKL